MTLQEEIAELENIYSEMEDEFYTSSDFPDYMDQYSTVLDKLRQTRPMTQVEDVQKKLMDHEYEKALNLLESSDYAPVNKP